LRSAGREPERPARGHAEKPPLGVERVEQREEVVLVRFTAVEEDERSHRLTVGRPEAVGEGREVGAQPEVM